MGCFSWKCSDSGRSICASGNLGNFSTFPVVMIAPDGRRWVEKDYDGYGRFGGKDIYELVAELNGVPSGSSLDEKRSYGIDCCFRDNPSGEFELAAKLGVVLPKLFENLSAEYDSAGFPRNCEAQGYFYDNDYDDECEEY